MNMSARHRYQVLDSLRGVCACMVVLLHFPTVGHISRSPLVQNGWLFVDFFFVLSGFVIATAYRQRVAEGLSIGKFMWLRMGRIYPLHLFVTGPFLALQLLLLVKGGGKAFQGEMSVGGLLASLTLTQTFVFTYGAVWNAPSWSIAVEMWTYLIFAAIFRLFRSGAGVILACAIVIAGSFGYLARFHNFDIDDVYFGAIFRCTYGFALGVIGVELHPLTRIRSRSFASICEIASICAVVIFISLVGKSPLSMAAPIMFLVLILIFANENGAISALLKMRFPLLVGELSYSIYMVHLFILYRITGLIEFLHKGSPKAFLICGPEPVCTSIGSPLLADALIIPILGLVIGVAYFTHGFIEKPCERWAKKQLSRRNAPAILAGSVL